MAARNSPLVFVLPIFDSSSSMASLGERGVSTLRSTQTRLSSSFCSSSSSFRVPLLRDVDRGEHAAVRELAIEVDFRVARALELFEDDFVHARAGVDERGGDDGQRAAFFDVTRGAEEPLGTLQRVAVHAA